MAVALLRDEIMALPARLRDEVVFAVVTFCAIIVLFASYPAARPWIVLRVEALLLAILLVTLFIVFRGSELYDRLRGRKRHWVMAVFEIMLYLILISRFKKRRVAIVA